MKPPLAFALFLFLLLVAPELPTGQSSISLAPLGLVLWFLATWRFPVWRSLTEPLTACLMVLAAWMLFRSSMAGSVASFAYAAHWALYVLLVPPLAVDLWRRFPAQAIKSLTMVWSIWLAGLAVSLWTGPIWEYQTAATMRGGMQRAVGFSSSVGEAGFIALWFAMFFAGRSSVGTVGALAGLAATMSRSAFVAGTLGYLGAFLMLRRVPRRIVLASAAVMAIGVVTVDVSGMRLDEAGLTEDAAKRGAFWDRYADKFLEQPPLMSIVGAGFRSSSRSDNGVLKSSHNGFLDLALDGGVVAVAVLALGLALFVMRAALERSDEMTWPVVVAASFMAHTMTQAHLYSVEEISLVLICLATVAARSAASDLEPARRRDRATRLWYN